MTPKERFYARLRGEPVDKIPNLGITMQWAAAFASVPYRAFCTDARALVKAQFAAAEVFGIDILSSMSDPYRETSAYGADIAFPADNLPLCTAPLLRDAADFPAIKVFDPPAAERTRDRIDAVRLFAEQGGGRYPVLGWVEGPLAEFCDLATLSEGFLLLMDEPAAVAELLDTLTAGAVAFALAQIEAGADVIGIGDAVASLVSPEQYRTFAFPFERRVIEAVHAAGAVVKLHICGDITRILPDVLNTGADIVDIDHAVDFAAAAKMAAGHCAVNGNFDPVAVLLQGGTDDVARATLRCAAEGGGTGFVSAGCEIPKGTPEQNLAAVDSALRGMHENQNRRFGVNEGEQYGKV